MQDTNSYPIYQRGQQNTDLGRDDGSCVRKTSVASTTVLIIAGISTGAVSRGLNHAAALSSPNGITLTVFDSLAHLPNYSETLEINASRALWPHCETLPSRHTPQWS